MREEQHRFLSLAGQLSASLGAEVVAWVLGCQPHDVPVLVVVRLLKPLGNPPSNGIKCFAIVYVLELRNDRSWLLRMTNAINQHWQAKNARMRTKAPPVGRRHRSAAALLEMAEGHKIPA